MYQECSAEAKTLSYQPPPHPSLWGKLEKGGRSQVLTMGSRTGLSGGVTQLWGYHRQNQATLRLFQELLVSRCQRGGSHGSQAGFPRKA